MIVERMGLDLQSYLDLFPDVCQTKFGRTYDFSKLEKGCQPLRDGKRWLVAKDVVRLFDPSETPLARYWGKPDGKQLDPVLSKSRIVLGPLVEKPEALVKSLLSVFHNIGQVSIILRFVHPDKFAIFGTPVINLLQVYGADAIQLYTSYCQELQKWQEHFKLKTIAHTEMALWTFDQMVKHARSSSETLELRKQFDEDLWIQRRRAALVLRPFLKNNAPLELAKIIVEQNPKLAGKLGAEEYERLLRVASRKFYKRELPLKPGAAEHLLDQMARDGYVSAPDKVDLRRVWELRNRVVHPDKSPDDTEVEWMLGLIERVCRKWDGMKPR
jgi:hypothetical protein